MGSRANYIIKSEHGVRIYYSHWRASYIAKDLYLGYEKLKYFIEQFDEDDEIINYPWIEGCILIDEQTKNVIFWEDTYLIELTLRREYLKRISEIWCGWRIQYAYKHMYDIEKYLNIDYISKQEIDPERADLDLLKNDKVDGYHESVIMIKEYRETGVWYTGCISGEEILLLGEEIINIIKAKPRDTLLKESEIHFWGGIAIDLDCKHIYYSDTTPRMVDEISKIWNDWNIVTGNFGHLGLLEYLGVGTAPYQLSKEEIEMKINEIINAKDDFDPNKFAKELIDKEKDVQFCLNFFENIKPNNTNEHHELSKEKRKRNRQNILSKFKRWIM